MAITQISGARVFSRLSADALPALDPQNGALVIGDLLVTEDGLKEQYSYGQAGWYERSLTEGAAHVDVQGVKTIARNRHLAAVDDGLATVVSTNEAFWPETSNVTRLEIGATVISGTVDFVKVVFNVSPDSDSATQKSLAELMLAVSDSPSNDVQWEKIIIGEEFIRKFENSPLRNCYMQAQGATPLVDVLFGGH